MYCHATSYHNRLLRKRVNSRCNVGTQHSFATVTVTTSLACSRRTRSVFILKRYCRNSLCRLLRSRELSNPRQSRERYNGVKIWGESRTGETYVEWSAHRARRHEVPARALLANLILALQIPSML